MRLTTTALIIFAVAQSASAQTQTESIKLTAPNPVWFEENGNGVAVNGETVLVSGSANRAWVFDAATGEAHVEMPTPPGNTPQMPVRLSSSHALVGVPIDDGGVCHGEGLVVYFDPSTGQEVYYFANPDLGSNRFGASVDLLGSKAVVSDSYNPVFGCNASAAHLLDLETHAELLEIQSTKEGITCVALSNEYVALVRYLDSSTRDIALHDSITGVLVRVLAAPGSSSSSFGNSVATDGEYLVAGDQGSGGVGAVYVYRLSDGALIHSIPASTTGLNLNRFGFAVDCQPGRFIVGAPSTTSLVTPAGAAFLFETASGRLLSHLMPSDGAIGDQFGIAVSLSGNLAVVGAPTHEAPGEIPAGAAYVYQFATCEVPINYCTGAPNSTGLGAMMLSMGEPSVSANAFHLGARQAPPGQTGIFFYGNATSNLPFGEGVLCVGGAIFRLEPPAAVLPDGTASHHLDFTQPPAGAGLGMITTGSTWNFQFWYRDPAGGGFGFNLSDGLRVVFCL